jgi:hypothetical protein
LSATTEPDRDRHTGDPDHDTGEPHEHPAEELVHLGAEITDLGAHELLRGQSIQIASRELREQRFCSSSPRMGSSRW